MHPRSEPLAARPPLDLAVVGCGVAGMAVAALLARAGHRVRLFERAPAPGPVGAGLLLQPSGQRVLATMGLLAPVAAVSEPIRELLARQVDGRPLIRLDFSPLGEGAHALGVARGTLFSTLLGACREAGVELTAGREIAGARESEEGVVLEAAGGTFGPFDGVVAADGSRSALRRAAGLEQSAHDYSYAALWALGPCTAVSGRLLQVVRGTRHLVGLLPVGQGRASFFWGMPRREWPGLGEGDFGAFRNRVVALCPEAGGLLEEIGGFDRMVFTTYRDTAARPLNRGRLVLLGDAAHSMSPHLGQGANLALEDAWAFAGALAAEEDFARAAERFAAARGQKHAFYSGITRLLSPFFQGDGRILGWGRDLALPLFPRLPWMRRQMTLTVAGLKRGWLAGAEPPLPPQPTKR